MDPSVSLLVVEDEPLILLSVQDVLEGGGFAVVSAATVAEGMRILDERHAELAGLITDIRLGDGPDGWDLARHARSLDPQMPVLYATGDSAHEWPEKGVPKSAVVQKPYAAAQLLTAISTLLTQADTTGTA